MSVSGYTIHDYEGSEDCSNFVYNATPLPGDEQCTHGLFRSPHCAVCGCNPDSPWHKDQR